MEDTDASRCSVASLSYILELEQNACQCLYHHTHLEGVQSGRWTSIGPRI
jgi:hypothetical protein